MLAKKNPNFKDRGSRNFRNAVQSMIHHETGLNIGDLPEEILSGYYKLMEIKREVLGKGTLVFMREERIARERNEQGRFL